MLTFLSALSTGASSTDCSAVVPFIATAHNSMVSSSALSAESGSSAITVGQTLTHPGRDFKTVEQNAPKINADTESGLEAAIDGSAAAQSIANEEIRSKAIGLLSTYQKRLSAMRTYAAIALEYERVVNSRDIEFSKARRAARQPEQTSVNSYTNGSGYGNTSITANATTLGGTTFISGNASTATNTSSSTNTTIRKTGPNNETIVQSFLSGVHDQATLNQIEPLLENLLQNVRDVPLTARYDETIWRQACPLQEPFPEPSALP